ncbi:MAG: carboxylesterase family protein [Solirubrobacterales bacterium]|nr:carboxylesterase family protein [Solirubrobacterales bacterium]
MLLATVIAALGAGGWAVASATLASAAPATVACAAGTDVQTSNGPVCGVLAGNVQEWLGIPYAAPPVGKLRWRPPQPPAPWTATLKATAFGNQCAQYFPLFSPNVTGSEDCLFVNVWRPADGSTNLPVMVHIHGGGFVAGSGNGDNTLLSNTGHEVIVSLNYRLGIFGFLSDSALGRHSGDYGLQDQQAALHWVQRNIAGFGGDPGNVTIFGESAGGSSVCDQIASPTARGLFERGISTSGEYNTLLGAPTPLEAQDCKSPLPTKAQARAAGRNFAAAVGCGSGTSDVAACLQAVPVDQAEKVSGFGYQDGGQGTVSPTINGSTLTMTLRQALRSGKVNRVDVIAGVDRDEDLVGTANTATDYQNLIDTQYGANASQVLARYPLSRFDSPGVAWRTVAADSDTVCPALETAGALASRMPVHAYEIDDNDLPPYTVGGIASGASHVGAWYLNPVTPPLDANQQVLQDQEVAYVTSFARTGDPNTTGAPIWPSFNPADNPTVISLQPAGDTERVSAAEISAQHNCAFWDRIAR